jgi:GDPmannose 4,6-dehydratase
MNKIALVFGITGQDGKYLNELLIQKKYKVVGVTSNRALVEHLSNENLLYGDLSSYESIKSILCRIEPDEIYNLASQSVPSKSWLHPFDSHLVNGIGPTYIFDIARKYCNSIKIFQATSSEIFGNSNLDSQNEEALIDPLNPYAASKAYAHNMVQIYRNKYNMYISSGILFNHESELRPLNFISQKICYGAACAYLNINISPDLNELGDPIVSNGKLALGNLDIYRDWGHARDYVYAMWLTLQQKNSDNYVIGTGNIYSLKELCAIAYGSVGIDWNTKVYSHCDLIRSVEILKSKANPSKANSKLKWTPQITFIEMISNMVLKNINYLKNKLNI